MPSSGPCEIHQIWESHDMLGESSITCKYWCWTVWSPEVTLDLKCSEESEAWIMFLEGIRYLKDIRYFWGNNIWASITWVFTLSSSNHLFIHTIRNNTDAALLTLSLPGHCRASTKRASGVVRERRGGADLMKALASVSDSSCQRCNRHLCPKPNPQHALPATLITFPFAWNGDPQNWQTGAAILIN